MRDRWSPWLPRQHRPYMETGDIILQRSGFRERERAKEQAIKRVRETEKAKKKAQRKKGRVSEYPHLCMKTLHRNSSLFICLSAAVAEEWKGGGEEEDEKRAREGTDECNGV